MTPLDLPALDVSGLAERALQDGKSWLERCRETTMYEGHPAVVINRLVDALTRLSAERDALIADNAELVGINADLSTRVEALEAALKPFADLGVSAYGPDDEHDDASYRLTRGSIRQARKALQAEGER